jgi:hypothetical protein
MRLDKRLRPMGADSMFVGNDRWICPNAKCGLMLEKD